MTPHLDSNSDSSAREAKRTPSWFERWDFDDPRASEQAFRGMLPVAEKAGEAPRCELLTQIARALGLQRRFDEGHAVLDQVEASSATLPARVRAYALLERGRLFNSAGHLDEARRSFLTAWWLASQERIDDLAVDAAHMLAIAVPEERVAWNEQAIARAEASSDPRARRWLASLFNNLAWARHEAGELDEALSLFERALELRSHTGESGAIGIAHWSVARCLRSMGRPEEALARQLALRAELERAGRPDGFVHEEIAECLLALGRPAEAGPEFATALGLLERDRAWVASEPERIERLRRLAGASQPGAPPA